MQECRSRAFKRMPFEEERTTRVSSYCRRSRLVIVDNSTISRSSSLLFLHLPPESSSYWVQPSLSYIQCIYAEPRFNTFKNHRKNIHPGVVIPHGVTKEMSAPLQEILVMHIFLVHRITHCNTGLQGRTVAFAELVVVVMSCEITHDFTLHIVYLLNTTYCLSPMDFTLHIV